MLFAFIVVLILTLLFLPLKLCINLSYYKSLEYNCLLYISRFKVATITTSKIKNKKHRERKDQDFKKILKLLSKLKHKPIRADLFLEGNLDFQLLDAAITALLSSCLYTVSSALYRYFNDLFYVKTYRFNITPGFTEEDFLDLRLKSILSFNLVKIIYIYIILKK